MARTIILVFDPNIPAEEQLPLYLSRDYDRNMGHCEITHVELDPAGEWLPRLSGLIAEAVAEWPHCASIKYHYETGANHPEFCEKLEAILSRWEGLVNDVSFHVMIYGAPLGADVPFSRPGSTIAARAQDQRRFLWQTGDSLRQQGTAMVDSKLRRRGANLVQMVQ